MFEREAGYKLIKNDLPRDITEKFIDNRKTLKSQTLMSWSEHCTECAIPVCYQTCNFYQPRQDLKCRRFPGGFRQVNLSDNAADGYLLNITFGKWSKLEAMGSTYIYTRSETLRKETFDRTISWLLEHAPLPYYIRIKAKRLYYGHKKKKSLLRCKENIPTEFVLEAFNPEDNPISIKLSIYNHENLRSRSYDKLVELQHGYNKLSIPYNDINSVINLNGAFSIKIETMTDGEHELYFGVIDFVNNSDRDTSKKDLEEQTVKHAKKIKCVVWDLDNTLWEGTLIEDGISGLTLNSEAVRIIHELDKRGILNSVASKNNYDDALKALKHFGLDNMFLYPQISWNQKSIAIRNIQTAFNIGMDTIAFIDDQEFEREEVKSCHSSVAIYNHKQVSSILTDERFNVPVTEDSAKRKIMYQQEIQRAETYDNSYDDYEKFLKECNIVLDLDPMTDKTIKRAYELAQRTNQMNFSGNRYSIPDLASLNNEKNKLIILISANDKFGSYGIVGMVILDTLMNCVDDLMFSCRIQSKMVDHAVLSYLIRRSTNNPAPLSIKYRESDKNKPASRIFNDLGFIADSKNGDTITLTFPNDISVPENTIIKINDNMAEML